MRTLILTASVLLLVCTLHARPQEPKEIALQSSTQVTTQPVTVNPPVPYQLSDSIKPGHPLDPADVDVLTGKRDRELEAGRQPGHSLLLSGYGYYGNSYGVGGRRGGFSNMPRLPLTRVRNPYFFLSGAVNGVGRGGFRGRR